MHTDMRGETTCHINMYVIPYDVIVSLIGIVMETDANAGSTDVLPLLSA